MGGGKERCKGAGRSVDVNGACQGRVFKTLSRETKGGRGSSAWSTALLLPLKARTDSGS
jgi:hypothetical protein